MTLKASRLLPLLIATAVVACGFTMMDASAETDAKGKGPRYVVVAEDGGNDGNGGGGGETPRVVDRTGSGRTYELVPSCGLGGIMRCFTPHTCSDGEFMFDIYEVVNGSRRFVGQRCFGDEEAPEAARPQITNLMVLRALRRIPVPAAKLVIQPPGGKTLVNFETIFHTEAEPFNRTVTLLGQRVELEITPATFVWKHGDSTSQTTSTPGVAFAEGRPMSDYITHSYEQARQGLTPSVDTTYSARFRVNGGAWQDVIGTVTIEGDPVDLQVVEGRPALVNAY